MNALALDLTSRQQTMEDFQRMNIPFYNTFNLRILPTGIDKYNDLLREIENSQKFIHLDYFKFQQDSICSVFFELLRSKARCGVEVRVVYDDVGNRYSRLPLRRSYVDSLRADGVQIYSVDPVK